MVLSSSQSRQSPTPTVKPARFFVPGFRRRAAVYVDGFNLFHAIEALGPDYLKWVDLWALAREIAPRSQVVRKVSWVTASRPQLRRQRDFQSLYFDAVSATGVTCHAGHFVVFSDRCKACGHTWQVQQEKQSDVNLALAVADDAHENRFDVCYLVTTDGDHAATARYLKQRFPQKSLVVVSPPGRRPNQTLLAWADQQCVITREQIERALLPAVIRSREGPIQRPPACDPPELPRRRRHLTLVASD